VCKGNCYAEKKIILLVFIFCFVISGCHVVYENQNIYGKSCIPKILPGHGGIIGQVIIDKNGTPKPGTPVHLAEVFHKNGESVFIIDTLNSPSSVIDESEKFSFSLIPTGEYVIIIGDPLLEHMIVSNDLGKAKDWIVQPDRIIDAGSIQFQSE
jgi:hypothetical protein